MRIVLINPPVPLKNIIVHPPLGLGYIAMILKQGGHDVKVIDMPILEMDAKKLVKTLRYFNPDLIGISTMSKTYAESVICTSYCKRNFPNVPIIEGGPHVTFTAEETLRRNKDVDIVTTYEGEYTMYELANVIENNKALENIKGICFRKDGKIVKMPVREPITKLDNLPYPDRKIYPIKKYLKRDDETTIIGARGCPFRCKFCSTTRMGRYLRLRSIENIIEELNHVLSFGFKSIFFSEDTFNFSEKRVNSFCDAIIKENLDFRWTCNFRLDLASKTMLEKMKKAGCYRVFVGIETSSGMILNNIDKKIDREKIYKTCKKIQSTGIEIHASFAFGMPGETTETIKESVKFAKQLRPDMISFNILTPYPGTELYEHPKKYGIVMPDLFWYENRDWVNVPIAGTESITPEKLEKLVKLSYIEYCSS